MQRYSKLFGKPNKNAKQFESVNAYLLQKGAFINQTMAGVYTFLPLGLRVLNKIESIIREEMNKIGQEVLMPALAPKELWEQTGRLETVDVLMKTSGANERSKQKSTNEYILNCTHEDVVTPIAQQYTLSYKDLPFALYQIQTKYRNEARAKSGLLRGREFRMKDLYSFHASQEDLKRYYEESKAIYWNVFRRLGIADKTVMALASGGDFTPDFSHEFQIRCEAGEDTIFLDKKTGVAFNKEVTPSKASNSDYPDEELLEMAEVEGIDMIGVENLAKFLNIPVEKTTKTILFENEKGEVLAAAVRGDYEVHEEKLKKISGSQEIKLASGETVKRVTNAEIGYAGILNLPAEVKVFMDDSLAGRKNFECGANKTNFHSINVNFGRDIDLPEKFYDIKTAKQGDINPDSNEPYEVFQACEIGNIFPLNTKFSKAIHYTYTDENGEAKPVYMGSYGIGPSRVLGIITEVFHDDKGIIWPETVAPYDYHLVTLGDKLDDQALDLINKIEERGKEVLWDDRTDVTPGQKFADADLIGIPTRIILSERSLTQGGLEVKKRQDATGTILSSEEFLKTV